jgi:uncharacterized damage-inducible protein DinB
VRKLCLPKKGNPYAKRKAQGILASVGLGSDCGDFSRCMESDAVMEQKNNLYSKSAFHQIEIVVNSILEMINTLKQEDLLIRPTQGKHSIGELLNHIALIPKADFLISEEADVIELTGFYQENVYYSIEELKLSLIQNYQSLKVSYESFSEQELLEESTSYWGVTYSRYEWLLEIAAHLYHHRGQLHAMLVHCCKQDPNVALFE